MPNTRNHRSNKDSDLELIRSSTCDEEENNDDDDDDVFELPKSTKRGSRSSKTTAPKLENPYLVNKENKTRLDWPLLSIHSVINFLN